MGFHPSEDDLEEYGFGRLDEPALGAVEEHLLICAPCRERLEFLDCYRRAMRSAARVLTSSHAA